MPRTYQQGDTARMEQDQIDVTCLKRMDEQWRFTDVHGHVHAWYDGDAPATSYSPSTHYTLPTLRYVKNGVEWMDGDEMEIGHEECRRCGEHVEPGYTGDSTREYIAGLRHYFINDESVTRQEFEEWQSSALAQDEQKQKAPRKKKAGR